MSVRNLLLSLLTAVLLLALGCTSKPAPAPPQPPKFPPTPVPTQPPNTPPTSRPQPTPAASTDDPCVIPGMTEESPIYTHQIYLTYTPDGKTFPDEKESQLILDHASVADLVIGPDGQLWAYYVNGETGRHGIFAARQTENGDWETLGCVTLNGEFNGNAVDPNIMRLPDGRYRLVYFQGNFVSQTLQPGDPNPIFSAISEDGLHFTVEGQLIAIPGATDPSLVQLPDGSWLLAVTAGGQTVFAVSEDGEHFTEFSQPIREIGIPELFVFPDGSVGLYLARMFISNDGGQTWQVAEGVTVPGNGADPSLVALPEGGYAFSFKRVTGAQQGSPPPATGEGTQPPGGPPTSEIPGGKPAFNPFANITAEQEACLREAWGEDAYNEITGFKRPPTQEEEPALDKCGLLPPPGEGQGMPPPGGKQGNLPPGGKPGNPYQGNPEDVALNLEITAPYLMAFHACDTSAGIDCNMPMNHKVYLAQSEDGVNWSLVPGWQPFQGSVPDVIRRGDTLYIYTPGTLTRYHLDTHILEASISVNIEGVTDGFVDPSLYIDEQGRLTLFFLYGQMGGDPAGCGDSSGCVRQIGSATEVDGSDGSAFTLDEGQRISVNIDSSSEFKSASDPDIFFDGVQYVLYLSHGPSISVWVSPELRGEYTRITELPRGVLTYGIGGVPTGYYDTATGQYWTYAHYNRDMNTPSIIRRAVHNDLVHPLNDRHFATVITGESIGLGPTYLVASPSFALNQP